MSSSTSELPQSPAELPLRGRGGRNSRSLAQLLFEQFSNQIAKGDWVVGDKLPTESELVRRYDVSRTVVREAISKLQTAGLAETRHGIGTFVLEPPMTAFPLLSAVELNESVDVLSVLELRISIETESAGLAAQRREPHHIETMRSALRTFSQNFEKGEDTVAHDLAFHLAIAAATGNRYFEEVLGHFGALLIPRTRITSINKPERDPEYLLRVNREHEEILQAIERQDPDGAKAAMRLHLTNSRERLRRAQQQAS